MIPEQHRVKVALMTASDAEYALRVINDCWDLEILSAAWQRAEDLEMPHRAAVISARMDRIRGS